MEKKKNPHVHTNAHLSLVIYMSGSRFWHLAMSLWNVFTEACAFHAHAQCESGHGVTSHHSNTWPSSGRHNNAVDKLPRLSVEFVFRITLSS